METPELLVVEDDPKVAHTIVSSLRQQGLHATRVGTGAEAMAHLDGNPVDLVVLDLGLPDMDGLDILRHLREKSASTPVLILTARDGIQDRIAGLDAGADDYLVKPFSLPELEARLRALVRRVDLGRQATLHCSDLSMDVHARTVTREDRPIELTPREVDLVQYLLEHQGQVVTRSMLATEVWKYTSRVTPIDNIIDVQMSRLRDKIDKPFGSPLIQTVRGVGFTLREPS